MIINQSCLFFLSDLRGSISLPRRREIELSYGPKILRLLARVIALVSLVLQTTRGTLEATGRPRGSDVSLAAPHSS